MIEVQTLWAIPWAVVGICCLWRWQLKQPEVTLLDLILGVVVGAIFGLAVPIVAALHNVKIKGGQHGAE